MAIFIDYQARRMTHENKNEMYYWLHDDSIMVYSFDGNSRRWKL